MTSVQEADDTQDTGNTGSETITLLLSRVNRGDREAFDRLIPLVYHELHRIAEGYLHREWQDQTLQPTALIHEAYLRLADSNGSGYQDRFHFYGVAARVMRQILVDHARGRQAAKRGGGVKVAYTQHFDVAPEQDRIVLALEDALNTLAREDDRKARLVEMRFFGGLTTEEIAEFDETPVRVVRRELRAAQAWLRREIEA